MGTSRRIVRPIRADRVAARVAHAIERGIERGDGIRLRPSRTGCGCRSASGIFDGNGLPQSRRVAKKTAPHERHLDRTNRQGQHNSSLEKPHEPQESRAARGRAPGVRNRADHLDPADRLGALHRLAGHDRLAM